MKKRTLVENKCKMYNLRWKHSTRKYNVGTKSCAQRDERFKKRPEIKEVVPSGEDPFQFILRFVKRMGLRNNLFPKNINRENFE